VAGRSKPRPYNGEAGEVAGGGAMVGATSGGAMVGATGGGADG
jgi:hypothetical protein